MKDKIRKEMMLCSDQGCCPRVKFVTRGDEEIVLIEDDHEGKVELKMKEWEILKDFVRSGKV